MLQLKLQKFLFLFSEILRIIFLNQIAYINNFE